MDMLLHAFLTSTLDGGKRDREYYWMEGCMGLRFSLDKKGEKKYLCFCQKSRPDCKIHRRGC
jgi:hypothetical protein